MSIVKVLTDYPRLIIVLLLGLCIVLILALSIPPYVSPQEPYCYGCHRYIYLGNHSKLGDEPKVCSLCHIVSWPIEPNHGALCLLNGTIIKDKAIQCSQCHAKEPNLWSETVHTTINYTWESSWIVRPSRLEDVTLQPPLTTPSPIPPKYQYIILLLALIAILIFFLAKPNLG
ncbi:MAG: hypothetical protein QXP91_00290 [Candidatus Methanomethylicia archaeon]